jgi:hypothetical protein
MCTRPYNSSLCWHQRRCRDAGTISVEDSRICDRVTEYSKSYTRQSFMSLRKICHAKTVAQTFCLGFVLDVLLLLLAVNSTSSNIIKREGMIWIRVAQQRLQWRVLVNTVMNLPVPEKTGNSLIAGWLVISQDWVSSMELWCIILDCMKFHCKSVYQNPITVRVAATRVQADKRRQTNAERYFIRTGRKYKALLQNYNSNVLTCRCLQSIIISPARVDALRPRAIYRYHYNRHLYNAWFL